MQIIHRLRCLLLVFLLGFGAQKAQAQVMGLVVDTAKAPLPLVQIFDRDGAKLGQTRLDGYFSLNLRTGSYKLIFSHPDFHSTEIPLVVNYNSKDTLNIILTPKTEKIGAVEIRRDYKDPAADYMRKAIAQRDFWHSRIPNQSAEIYIKAFEITEQKFKNKPAAVKVDTDIDPLDAAALGIDNNPYTEGSPTPVVADTSKNKTSSNASALVEIAMQRDASTDGKIKETRNGVQKVG
ncbi:MAG: carboxypeptidase-like regulatory domain-containing protein, partial [Bacteroidota bacterium]